MSVELSILRLFCDSREMHNAHRMYVESVENLEREVKTLFKMVGQYYEAYECESINKDELCGYYDLKYPNSKNRPLYMDIIHHVYEIEVNESLMRDLLDHLIEKHTATAIINKLIPTMEGSRYGILHEVKSDVENYLDVLHNPPAELTVPEPCETSLADLVKQEIEDEGIPWHIPALTNIIGGVRSKTLGLIYAYVDSGKTSFSLSAMAAQSHALAESDETIVYACNEENAERVRLRFVQALTNRTRQQILADVEGTNEIAFEKGLDRVKIFNMIDTQPQVLQLLDTYHPYIMYIDQATNVEIVSKRNAEGVEYLRQLFRWYRQLADKYTCALIAVSQGKGTSENTKWLKLSDIYGSNVAIQGALDYGIGIGRKVDEPGKENLRYIHVPKNKLSDGSGGKIVIQFLREMCLWRNV